MALSVLMLCAPIFISYKNGGILVFCPFSHEKIDINPEKCIWIIESSDNQIDKPQRGCPKRAELPDVKINTKTCKAYTEKSASVSGKKQTMYSACTFKLSEKKTVLITSKKKFLALRGITDQKPLPHFVLINFINFRFYAPYFFKVIQTMQYL